MGKAPKRHLKAWHSDSSPDTPDNYVVLNRSYQGCTAHGCHVVIRVVHVVRRVHPSGGNRQGTTQVPHLETTRREVCVSEFAQWSRDVVL